MEESQEIAEKKVLDLIQSLLPDGCPILNCYRWGSKWLMQLKLILLMNRWGTSHEKSDWDFLAVVGDEYDQPKIGNVAQEEDIDVSIITLSNFNQLLDMHVPWTLPFLFYPKSGIMCKKVEFKQKIEYMILRKAMLTNMDINLRQAKRVWNVEKNYYRAKKRVKSGEREAGEEEEEEEEEEGGEKRGERRREEGEEGGGEEGGGEEGEGGEREEII